MKSGVAIAGIGQYRPELVMKVAFTQPTWPSVPVMARPETPADHPSSRPSSRSSCLVSSPSTASSSPSSSRRKSTRLPATATASSRAYPPRRPLPPALDNRIDSPISIPLLALQPGSSDPRTTETDVANSACCHLAAGLSVGFCGIAAGFAIGKVGDAGVRAFMDEPRVYVGMVLILIFGEVLGLYGCVPSHGLQPTDMTSRN